MDVDPQNNLLKIGALKDEIAEVEIVEALTRFRRVTRKQFMSVTHTGIGVEGNVTLANRATFRFLLEPKYSLRVFSHDGSSIYFLSPSTLLHVR